MELKLVGFTKVKAWVARDFWKGTVSTTYLSSFEWLIMMILPC